VKSGYKLVQSRPRYVTYRIPDDWDEKRFGDICDFQRGLSYSSSDLDDEDGNYLINLLCFKIGGGFKDGLKFYNGKENNNTLLDPNDLVIAITEVTLKAEIIGYPLLVPKLNKKKIFHSMDCCEIQPKIKILIEYLYYFLCTVICHTSMHAFSSATTVMHLNLDSVKNIRIPIPSYDEQKQIVKILSNVDRLITITQKIIDQNILLKQGLMQRLITKGIGHKKFQEIQYGVRWMKLSIPLEWNVEPLTKIAKFRQGLQIDKKKRYTESGKNRSKLIKVLDFYKDKESDEYIDTPLDSKKSVICDKDDVIIARTGNTLGMILTDVEGVFHNNTFALDYDQKLFEKYFFYYFLQSYSVQLLMKVISTRTGQPDLTHKEFSILKVPIPPLNEQKQISTILSNINSKIEFHVKYKEKLDNLKKSLLQKLLTGEVRVKI
jgi:type I restriction enzyme, S subunit